MPDKPLESNGAGLDLAGFVDGADRQAAPPAGLAGGFIQPGHGEPAHSPYRRNGVPHRAAEQPLGPVRGAVSCLCGDRPPVAFWGSGSSPRRRTCPPAATAQSARNTAAAVSDSSVIVSAPKRFLGPLEKVT